MKKILSILSPLFGIVLFTLALFVLHHSLKKYHYHELLNQISKIPLKSILCALLLTSANYLVLTFYDTLGFHYLKRSLSYKKIALTSFIAYSFSHNIGYSILSGGPVRYRLYSNWKVSASEVTKIIVFSSLSFWLGFLWLGGGVLLYSPPFNSFYFSHQSLQLGGFFLLILGIVYLTWTLFRRKPIRFKQWHFKIPSLNYTLIQISISMIEWSLSAAILYVLLPQVPNLSYFSFLGIYLLAQMGGIVSHVPGGLGVFETILLWLLPTELNISSVFGAILTYRGIYYFLPLTLSIILLGIHESWGRDQSPIKKIIRHRKEKKLHKSLL